MTSRTGYLVGVCACALLSVLLRLRFVFTPITADEGGFLAIARAWRHGRDLYSDVWVDRPQGLLILFRVWDVLSGGNTQSVRVMGVLFGVLAVFGAAAIGRSMVSNATGVIAALFVAVASSAPALEGFLANGELLSGSLSVAAVAIGCVVLSGRVRVRWMAACGTIGAAAISVKQSGFDGLAAVGIWLILAFAFGWRSRKWTVQALGWLCCGSMIVLGTLVVHGALTGWRDWWFAVAGYRLESRSAAKGADWSRLSETAADALPILIPLVIGAGLAGTACSITHQRAAMSRTGDAAPRGLLPVWLITSLVAFAMGGQFFHHYWVILTFPVSVTAAVLVGSMRRTSFRGALAAAIVLPGIISALSFISLPRDEVPLAVSGYARSVKEEKVGEWFRLRRRGSESMYVMCASASFYAHANLDPPYPYLWLDNVANVPGARRRLRELLTSPQSQPTYVALFQTAKGCAFSGEHEGELDKHYRRLTTVDGVPILVTRSATTAVPTSA